MAKKKSKEKSAEHKARKAEKQEKAAKKSSKKAKSQDVVDDPDDVDIDAVLEEYKAQQAAFLKVTENPLPEPPPARTNATLTASPTNSNELFLFGGESFNGSRATFFNDLYVHLIDRNEWRQITSPNSPLPRSGHWCVPSHNSIYLFGGEFSSPKQGTFYHYGDFWQLSTQSREWTKIEGKKGPSPSARSGHRMVMWKNYVVLFGGFSDTSMNTKYLGDLWIFDLNTYTWTDVNKLLPTHAQKPEARSGFSFLPHEGGAVLFGGYARVKGATGGKGGGGAQGKGKKSGSSNATRVVLKPMFYTDTWFLRMNTDPKLIRWERRKKPTNSPNPPRAGVSMAFHKGRGIMFGGVHDVEESEEGIDSQFFNDLFAYATDRNRFFRLELRRPRVNANKRAGGGRRDRAKEDEDELLENLRRLQALGGSKITDEEMDELLGGKDKKDEEEEPAKPAKENSYTLPHPRFDSALAVQGDSLYIYGGRYEAGDKEDREVTFDEMFAVDLGKLDGVREIFSRGASKEWEASDDEDDDEDEDDEDDDEEEEEEVESKVEKEIDSEEEERRRKAREERKSRKKKTDAVGEEEPAATAEQADAEADAEEASDEPEDPTPHPRPFESLREFFTRTSENWQAHILTVLQSRTAWYGMSDATQQITHSVKEIRKEAFKAAEEKWWACREEMRALEDEREESGIGEVVNLKEKEAAGGGGTRRR